MPESHPRVAAQTMLQFNGARSVPIESRAPTQTGAAGDVLVRLNIDGRYDVEALLGRGGMGAVYRVQHTALGRRLALKALHEQLAHDAELASRFEYEARTMGRLQHPGIVE